MTVPALLRRFLPTDPEPVVAPDPAKGVAYVCRRCDVYGTLAPAAPWACWYCEQADRLERR